MDAYETTKRDLLTLYNLDLVQDVLLEASNRVFFYGNHREQKEMKLHFIRGDVSIIDETCPDSIRWNDLFKKVDLQNQFASVAGEDEYLRYLSSRFFDYSKEQDFSIPLRLAGKKRWIRIQFYPIKKNPDLLFFQMMDVSDFLNAEEEMYYKTHHDSLTKLLNKYALDYHYGVRYQLPHFHALYLDLDCFKNINDRYGHIVGDQFLAKFSEILQSYQSGLNRFYRIGGDEFVGLFFDSSERLLAMAQEILVKTQAIQLDYQLSSSVSIGIVQATKREDVIRKADQAMYLAKAKGKNQIVFVSEDEWVLK